MDKILKPQKITLLFFGIFLIIILSITIPTLSRYKNRILNTTEVWNGSLATKYNKGTGDEDDPYIISNGAELLYFYSELNNTNYEGKYFSLSNDIILNSGIFKYETEKIKYNLNDTDYYVKPNTNEYYDDDEYTTKIGEFNLFNSINNFKGNFDGNFYTIYGLYIYDIENEEVALFTNLEGNINNLYLKNTLIYGGNITSGIASNTNNSLIKNVVFDGNVITKEAEEQTENNLINDEIISVQPIETTNYINLTNNILKSGVEIVSTSITGNYQSASNVTLKINDNLVNTEEFNISLGNQLIDSLEVKTIADTLTDITLTNLSYNITYKYNITSGIVGIANNTTISNTVNKANIYGYSISSGIVGFTNNNLQIERTYNTGNINGSSIVSGLVGVIEKSINNISIEKSYNTGAISGNINGGIIGEANNNIGIISLNHIFNTDNYSIGNKINSTINITKGYYTNEEIINNQINNDFSLITIEDLYDKEFVLANLLYNEFTNYEDLKQNENKVWIYEADSLPILYIDDSNNPKINLQLNIYSWNNYSTDLNTIKLNTNMTFRIQNIDELSSLSKSYYIYNAKDKEPLTKEELDLITTWTPFTDIVTIDVEGIYIVYAKVIDNDKTSYVNSDLIILDLSGSNTTIKLEEKTWNTQVIEKYYIDRPKEITIEATDDISGVKKIEYFISNEPLNIDNITWNIYTNPINIDQIGEYIIYAKVTDNCDYITYVNTDIIIYDGYVINSFNIGKSDIDYQNTNNITNNSSIRLNTTYTKNTNNYEYDYTHNLISNILLPINTKITLIDNKTNRIYKYEITTSDDLYNYNSCTECIKKAIYPFTLFKEIGLDSQVSYTENSYYTQNVIAEDFTVIIDFTDSDNYEDVMIYVELLDNNEIVRPTLYSNLKKFNIYKTINSEETKVELNLLSDYSGEPIIYNSDSMTNINITSGLNYKFINSNIIADTTIENKKMGLSIKLVDEDGQTINKNHLKNMIFKIDNDTYSPDNDNIIHINLNNKINDITKLLTIETRESNSNLPRGNYYLKISNYLSSDGYYFEITNTEELSVPVNVIDDNYNNIIYGFDVIMNDEDRIISKIPNDRTLSFDILQKGTLYNPNIRVSLYKKDDPTTTTQDYTIVDLQHYTTDVLNKYIDNVYYVSTNPLQYNDITKLYNNFTINLNMSLFENNGYKFVFDLYDGMRKIGRIDKYFIVK